MITAVDDPGRVATYESLLRRAWSKPDRGSSSGPNLVRAIVKGLRRKLADDAANPAYIRNECGVGCRSGPSAGRAARGIAWQLHSGSPTANRTAQPGRSSRRATIVRTVTVITGGPRLEASPCGDWRGVAGAGGPASTEVL